MIATYILAFPDFDYAGWAEQLGLTVIESKSERSAVVFAEIGVTATSYRLRLTVQGEKSDIDQFSAELDAAPIKVDRQSELPAHSCASHYS